MRAVVLLSGCRAPRLDGCRRRAAPLALVFASLVSIPFLFLKRRENKEDPAAVLPLRPVPLLSSSGCFPPPELSRRPGAPSRRRRPSLANYGRRRRGGAPGPLVSSRAKAEAVFLFLFLFLSSLLLRADDAPRPDEESDLLLLLSDVGLRVAASVV